MNRSILAVTVGSLLSYAPYSLAEQADETVVVTANRFEQKLDSSIVPIEVVTKEEIEATQSKNLLEVLRRLPGVQVSSNGGYGQSQSVFIRGAESDHVLFLIDGVRFGSATSGTAAIASIPLAGVERIEYLRGARAALYGSDAIAGVINVITANNRSESVLSTTIGSDSYYQGQGFFSGNLTDALHASMSLNALNNEGFSAKNTVGDEDADSYRSRDVAATIKYQFSKQSSLMLNALVHEGNLEYDPQDSTNEENFYNVALRYNFKNEKYVTSLTASTNQDSTFYPASNGTYQTDRKGVAWDNLYHISDSLSVGGGIDWYEDDVSKSSTLYDEVKRDNTAFYLSSFYNRGILSVEGAVRSDDNERYGNQTTWQLGAGVDVLENYRLSFNAGTGFKAPTFNDLYFPGWGNPNLEPEESESYEIALDATYSLLDVRISAYMTNVDNMIVGSGSNASNVGKAEIRGIEIIGKFETGPFTHQLSYDYNDPENKDTGKQLDRRAKDNVKWNIGYFVDDLILDLSYLYQGERTDGSETLDAYSLVDFAVTYNVTADLVLKGRVANVFDENYTLATDYNTQERSYFATVQYNF
ncbi:TonB-dependent receptor domain-containing protein [Vibrio rhodolitus]|uniref:TonB-dependent receptor domain-containing protein n=1 Tax=Vibrio rhodolitus TaxID=2231649 RepID=UPI000E0BEFA6|nr:TonB-dependent receptor [Vibrio rhodolitus]